MPGIDFRALQAEISMRQVLDALGFEPTLCLGAQWRGSCPIHGSTSTKSRSLSVNVESQRHHCHSCGSQGNQFELWAALHQLPLHAAALDLCCALHHDVPWIHRLVKPAYRVLKCSPPDRWLVWAVRAPTGPDFAIGWT